MTTSPSRPPVPPGVRVLLAIVAGKWFAIVGMTTVLGKLVFDRTGSELDLGLLGLAQFVPTAALAPFTGTLADRHDRRRVAAAAQGLEAAVVASVAVFAAVDPDPTWPIFGLALLFGVGRAFDAPASRALPVDLAPPGSVERVVAVHSVAFQSGAITGPVTAGFLYVVAPWLAFAVPAAVLGVGAIAMVTAVPESGVARMRAAPSEGPMSSWHAAVEGLRFVRRTPVLFGAMSLDLAAVLFAGAVALLPAIAEERLGVGAVGLGWLRAATGIGAGGVALALSARPLARRVGPVFLLSVAVFGVATIVLALTRSYAVAFLAVLVLSGADAVSMFIRGTLLPLATPEDMRGRVLAVEQVFIGASNELGDFESGVAAAVLGLVGAVLFGGISTLVVVGVWAVAFPDLRRVDRFDDVRPEVATGGAPP